MRWWSMVTAADALDCDAADGEVRGVMPRVLLDGQSAQAIVHRWDGVRLRDVCEALTETGGFEVAFSDDGVPLSDQLQHVAVFVITSRYGPPVAGEFAHPQERIRASGTRPEPAYSAEDLAAITGFVARGGGLLLMSNHGDLPGRNPADWTRHDRALGGAFGVSIEPAWFAGPPPDRALPTIDASCLLTDHPIIRGGEGDVPVRELVVGPCCALKGGPDAVPLVRLSPTMVDWRDGRPVNGHRFAVALDETQERHGRVVVAARSGFLGSAGTEFPGPGLFQRADNRRFVVNAVRWLARAL